MPHFAAVCLSLHVAPRRRRGQHAVGGSNQVHSLCSSNRSPDGSLNQEPYLKGGHMRKTRVLGVVVLGVILAATFYAELVRATKGSGTSSTLLGRGTFDERVRVSRELAQPNQEWEVEVEAEPSLDVATQIITFQPGGQSGWHSHPGPVFITVMSGTMTFYEADDPNCQPIVRTAGQGYLDRGEHAHNAPNQNRAPATNIATYFSPLGAALRIDQPQPGNCPSF